MSLTLYIAAKRRTLLYIIEIVRSLWHRPIHPTTWGVWTSEHDLSSFNPIHRPQAL